MHKIIAARISVFIVIVEQNCPYQEADNFDHHSWHLVGYHNDDIISCLGVVDPGFRFPEVSIGRVMTTKNYRGKGWESN